MFIINYSRGVYVHSLLLLPKYASKLEKERQKARKKKEKRTKEERKIRERNKRKAKTNKKVGWLVKIEIS